MALWRSNKQGLEMVNLKPDVRTQRRKVRTRAISKIQKVSVHDIAHVLRQSKLVHFNLGISSPDKCWRTARELRILG